PQAVHGVGGYVHEVALRDLRLVTLDGHEAPARGDVVELVRGVGVGVDGPAARHLELVDQLEVTAVRDLLHLLGSDEPPHRHRADIVRLVDPPGPYPPVEPTPADPKPPPIEPDPGVPPTPPPQPEPEPA